MPSGRLDGEGDAEQQLLARALGALIAVRRFDLPIYQARAAYGATLALSLYADNLPAPDAERIKVLRQRSLDVALSDGLGGISETDRDWLITMMRNVLRQGRRGGSGRKPAPLAPRRGAAPQR